MHDFTRSFALIVNLIGEWSARYASFLSKNGLEKEIAFLSTFTTRKNFFSSTLHACGQALFLYTWIPTVHRVASDTSLMHASHGL